MSDDYFHACQEARELGEQRRQREALRCQERGITPEMKRQAGEEISSLYVGLLLQPPSEQIRRYERMFELADIRGYLYDPDPLYDLVRIRIINERIQEMLEGLPDEG